METGIEGIGEAVTGDAQVSRAPHGSALSGGMGDLRMLARAVEPGSGEAGATTDPACLNCGAALDGAYCRQCGQKAHVHRSVGAFAHDLVHGILHLDGKLWRTLPLLAWRPGELTRRYVHGERARFVSPMAMFLFSIFLMFATLSIYGLSLSSLDVQPGVGLRQGLETARADVVRELEAARAQRAALQRGETVRDADGRVMTPQRMAARVAELEDRVRQVEQFSSGTQRWRFVGDGEIRTGWERLDHGLEKFNENPSLALYKLQSNGYKFSWLLIPLSVPFVWLLFFWTRRFHIYDHTVFVTYSLAFMSLLAVALTVLGFIGLGAAILTPAALLIPPVHMFRQLKQAYQLHWAGALLRTFLLLIFCWVTATLFFMLLLGIGALG